MSPFDESGSGFVGNHSSPVVLSFDGVSKMFADGTTAVQDVRLDVTKGEVVSVVGPSGCGKSTLLRIAASLETCSTGSCRVNTARVGYVFQEPTLLPWRTVAGNVRLVAELEGIPGEDISARVDRALSLVDMAPSAAKLPHQLSGGMKMRTSLARSLVMEPELFLLDEPFGALDEFTRERLNDELLSLHARLRFAALFVTHSIHEAVFLSRRVVLLSAGPGRVIRQFDVPFTYPRLGSLRYDPEFARLCGEIAEELRAAST